MNTVLVSMWMFLYGLFSGFSSADSHKRNEFPSGLQTDFLTNESIRKSSPTKGLGLPLVGFKHGASWLEARGCYSETGFHIGMDRNFVCLWRRHNCNWSLPFCADLLTYEINYLVLNNYNLHAIMSTLLVINLQWV